jgi:hypothetical protein
MTVTTCSKCGAHMELGYLLDRGDHNVSGIATWIEGQPRRGLFGALKISGRRRLQVATMRCERCGFLESYAPDA